MSIKWVTGKTNLYYEIASFKISIHATFRMTYPESGSSRQLTDIFPVPALPLWLVWGKRFQPRSSFAWRRLQGARCTGESAYSPIKPQERTSWKLLVNTTGGNWHSPRRPSVWTRLSVPATLHLSRVFCYLFWLFQAHSCYLSSVSFYYGSNYLCCCSLHFN